MMTLFELLRSLQAVEYRLAHPTRNGGRCRYETTDRRLAEALRARIPAEVLANYEALRTAAPQWTEHPELFPMAVALEPLGRYATREAPLDLVVCEACGLVFANPMLTDERKHELQPDVRRLHRSRSSELSDERALRRSRQRAARWEYLITSQLPPGSRVLELGAGDGALIELLLQHGHHPVALDPDESACAFLRQRFNIETIPCRVEDADLSSWGSFEAVFLLNLIEHLEDPAAVLTKIADRLRPGGLVAMETPNILRTKVGPRRMFSLPHNYYFSPTSLLRLVTAQGFHPVHCRVFHRDMFHLTARWGGPLARGLPATNRHAGEVRRAIRRHAWAYYFGAQFLLRKLPVFRQWYLYGRFADWHFEEAPVSAGWRLPRRAAAVRCALSLLATIPA